MSKRFNIVLLVIGIATLTIGGYSMGLRAERNRKIAEDLDFKFSSKAWVIFGTEVISVPVVKVVLYVSDDLNKKVTGISNNGKPLLVTVPINDVFDSEEKAKTKLVNLLNAEADYHKRQIEKVNQLSEKILPDSCRPFHEPALNEVK